jgi:hypothetical protein
MTEVHVIPDAWTRRRVDRSEPAAPPSEHDTVNEAELAAQAHAADRTLGPARSRSQGGRADENRTAQAIGARR